MFAILLLSIFLSVNYAWAGKLCLKEIDGEKVYTNLCDRGNKSLILKKPSKVDIKYKPHVPKSISNYSKEQLEKIVEDKAATYGVDAKLIKEIIKEESNWNVYATSHKGAMGLMQLMPSTALLVGVLNPYNPEENIDGGIRYLKYLLERFNGNLSLALAAYNAGPNLVESLGRIPNIAETQQYVARISMRYNGAVSPHLENTSSKKRSSPIKALILSDGTVLYTNREDIYLWTRK